MADAPLPAAAQAPPAGAQAPPAAARQVFGSALPVARAYADLLTGAGVERGLIGPAEATRIWGRHLLNCAVVAELIPPSTSVIADLGSGAGLPGIVLAILLPEVRVILVEPMARRTAFLVECVDRLALRNAEVCRGRAENLAGQVQADVVTARAVAGLDRLAVLAAGLARPGGVVLAIKGASAGAELERARPILRRLGASGAEVVTAGAGVAGAGVAGPSATVVRFMVRQAPGDSEPSRSAGQSPAARRPR